MEQLAPYRNKLKAFIWVIILLGAGYIMALPKIIPSKWVKVNDVHLTRLNGFLYYNHKAFSGWLFSNYDNGNREREIPYYEGKEEGIMKSWYPDKKPQQERLFVNGKKEGVHKGWWPNSNIKFEYEFKNDEHNGLAREWFDNNELYRSFHYTEGHEEGLQQLWWANGKVRANYVVKDGVQYGLIGRKFCKNVFKNDDVKTEPIKKVDSAFGANYGL